MTWKKSLNAIPLPWNSGRIFFCLLFPFLGSGTHPYSLLFLLSLFLWKFFFLLVREHLSVDFFQLSSSPRFPSILPEKSTKVFSVQFLIDLSIWKTWVLPTINPHRNQASYDPFFANATPLPWNLSPLMKFLVSTPGKEVMQ